MAVEIKPISCYGHIDMTTGDKTARGAGVANRPQNRVANTSSWTVLANHWIDWAAPILIAVAVFLYSAMRPAFRPHTITALVLCQVAYLLIRMAFLIPESLRPFNYLSLRLSENGFVYEDSPGRTYAAAWHEIEKVEFARYMEWHQQRAWLITLHGGKIIEVLDEWPDRRKLLAAFWKYLPGFSFREARRGFHSWKEGRWSCFARNPVSPHC